MPQKRQLENISFGVVTLRARRAHEKLKQEMAEARFRGIYEHALAGIAILDWKDGRYLQCNRAFCNGGGRLAIEWSLQRTEGDEEAFVISWGEAGGPAVTPPAQRGFGSIVVQRMAREALDAEVDLGFAPEGLSWRLRCPAKEVAEARPPSPYIDGRRKLQART